MLRNNADAPDHLIFRAWAACAFYNMAPFEITGGPDVVCINSMDKIG